MYEVLAALPKRIEAATIDFPELPAGSCPARGHARTDGMVPAELEALAAKIRLLDRTGWLVRRYSCPASAVSPMIGMHQKNFILKGNAAGNSAFFINSPFAKFSQKKSDVPDNSTGKFADFVAELPFAVRIPRHLGRPLA